LQLPPGAAGATQVPHDDDPVPLQMPESHCASSAQEEPGVSVPLTGGHRSSLKRKSVHDAALYAEVQALITSAVAPVAVSVDAVLQLFVVVATHASWVP
jgi:hypothetical protein